MVHHSKFFGKRAFPPFAGCREWVMGFRVCWYTVPTRKSWFAALACCMQYFAARYDGSLCMAIVLFMLFTIYLVKCHKSCCWLFFFFSPSLHVGLRYPKWSFFFEFFIYCFVQSLSFFRQVSTLAGAVGETKKLLFLVLLGEVLMIQPYLYS